MFDQHDTPEEKVAPGTMMVRADAKAIGAVTALTHKAHSSSWETPIFKSGRVRGFATEKDDIDTMKVYNLNDPGADDWNPDTFAVKDVPRKGRRPSNRQPTADEVAAAEKVAEATKTDLERFTNLVNDIGSDFS